MTSCLDEVKDLRTEEPPVYFHQPTATNTINVNLPVTQEVRILNVPN